MFPDELYQAPRSWAERAYPNNLIHYNRLDRGGHFAAWEQPQLFCSEMPDGVPVASRRPRVTAHRLHLNQMMRAPGSRCTIAP